MEPKPKEVSLSAELRETEDEDEVAVADAVDSKKNVVIDEDHSMVTPDATRDANLDISLDCRAISSHLMKIKTSSGDKGIEARVMEPKPKGAP